MTNHTGVIAQEISSIVPMTMRWKDPQPNNIVFQVDNGNKELLRISKDGITAPSDLPIDETAKLILATLNDQIKSMVIRTWVKLDSDELRECYSLALQHDIDLAVVIQDKFIAKNAALLNQGENV